MDITVNGKPHSHHGDGILSGLLREMKADKGRVAVLVNGNVIPSAQHATLRLRDGMAIEIIVMAGGG